MLLLEIKIKDKSIAEKEKEIIDLKIKHAEEINVLKNQL